MRSFPAKGGPPLQVRQPPAEALGGLKTRDIWGYIGA